MRRYVALLGLVASLTCTLPVMAAGLLTPDAGIVGLGRGGAFTALADDIMAAHYNPAGLWQLDGVQFSGGLILYEQRTTFLREGGEGRWKLDDMGAPVTTEGAYEAVHNQDKFRPIPEVALSIGLDNPDLTFAIGLYAPLAPWLTYPEYGANRYRMTYMRILQGNFFLSAGWRIADFIAVGAGFQLLYIEMKENFWAPSDIQTSSGSSPEHPQWDIHAEFQAQQWKPYWNAGIMVMPKDWLRFGVSFYPSYTFRGKGSVNLEGNVGGDYLKELDETMGQLVEFTDTSSMLVTGTDDDLIVSERVAPILKFGVLVAPTAWLNLEVDAEFQFWKGTDAIQAEGIDVDLMSEDGNTFVEELQSRVADIDACELGLVDCTQLESYKGPTGDGTYSIVQNYKNTFSIRFGGEIQPIQDVLGFRFGYGYESSAVPDETLNITSHDLPKHLLACGVSGRFKGFQAHFTYAHIFYEERTVAEADSVGVQTGLGGTPVNKIDAGTYSAASNILGLNLVFDFTGMHKAAKERKAAAVAQNQGLLASK